MRTHSRALFISISCDVTTRRSAGRRSARRARSRACSSRRTKHHVAVEGDDDRSGDVAVEDGGAAAAAAREKEEDASGPLLALVVLDVEATRRPRSVSLSVVASARALLRSPSFPYKSIHVVLAIAFSCVACRCRCICSQCQAPVLCSSRSVASGVTLLVAAFVSSLGCAAPERLTARCVS